jgi:[ribosomal protein S18]-alanine N-acetyltransferase
MTGGTMADDLVIVPASSGMVSDILRLEEACFSAPWTRKMLEAELSGNPFAHFLVARDGAGAVVGYHCFWIVFEELRLMNLAVCESRRRQGLARRLVIEALRTGLSQAATRAVLEVRASNDAALALYRQLGFAPVSTRRQYYTNPIEDAVLMELDPLVVPAQLQGRVPNVGGGSVPAH